MTVIDRVERQETKPPAQTEVRSAPQRGGAAKRGQDGASKFYYWSFFIHKWAGLIGAAWLAVLGLTGFFLDHDSWRWLQQGAAPAFLTPESLEKSARQGVARLLQVDPDDRAHQVTGGQRGLWRSQDGGTTWTPTRFANGDRPQILAIEPDPTLGWKRLWLATDDGIYSTQDEGESAARASLPGVYVTALAAGASNDEMLAVVDKSEVLRFSTQDPTKKTPVELAPIGTDASPKEVSLYRVMFDLHFGKGVAGELPSLVMNDVAGVAMFVLSLTGLLYWGLPKWWKARGKRARTPKAARRATIVWLFRFHSATLGVASVLMLLYLSITGIFLGHTRELTGWMKATPLPQGALTPAFKGASWNGAIESIAGYPGQPEKLSLGGRLGLFTSTDGGDSWTQDKDADGVAVGAAYRLRRIGDKVLVPGGMAGPSLIRGDDATVQSVKAATERARGGGMEGMFMPSDVTRSGRRYLWKSSTKAVLTDADGEEIGRFNITQPVLEGTPWFRWLLRLHMGTIFWSEWKWVNDVFAVLAVFLSVTGLVRWWRQKWI